MVDGSLTEVRRNRTARSKMYTHYWACEMVKWRKRFTANKKHRKMTAEVGVLVESLITQYLSPEQVSGYLKEHHNLSLSHETIYRFIYEDKQRHEDLKPFLRQERNCEESATDQVPESQKYPIVFVSLSAQR